MSEEFMSLGELREFVDKVGPQPAKANHVGGMPVRMSQCTVVSVNWGFWSISAREFGDQGIKTDIPFDPVNFVPRVGMTCWLIKWGTQCAAIPAFPGVFLGVDHMHPMCQLRSGTSFSVPASMVYARINNWDFQVLDTDGMITLSGAPAVTDKITLRTPGVYSLNAEVMFNDASSVPVMRGLRIGSYASASTYYAEDRHVYDNTAALVNEDVLQCHVDTYEVLSDQVPQDIAVWIAQGGTGALGTATTPANPRFEAVYRGPVWW